MPKGLTQLLQELGLYASDLKRKVDGDAADSSKQSFYYQTERRMNSEELPSHALKTALLRIRSERTALPKAPPFLARRLAFAQTRS